MVKVNKNSIQLSCTTQRTANLLRNELVDFLRHEFYPKLESLLKAYDTNSMIWEINHLPIGITVNNNQQWKEIFLNESLKQVRLYLRQHQPYKKPQESTSIFENTKDDVQSVNVIEDVLSFLKTGQLNMSKTDFNRTLEAINWTRQSKSEVFKVISEDTEALFRFVFSFPNTLIDEVLEKKNLNLERENQKLSFKTVIFSLDCQNFLKIINQTEQLPSGLKGNLLETLDNYFKISEIGFKFWLSSQPKSVKEKFSELLAPNPLNLKQASFSQNLSAKSDGLKFKENKQKRDLENTFYISNAGLIILQPFLAKLFRQLGYLEAETDNFKSISAQHRSVLITQYLINFKEDIFEKDLVLNKTLSGLTTKEAINTSIDFTDQEKTLSKELLQSVITHWKILKNTSVETLQVDFLQRRARLSKENDTWELTVEASGIDILLSHLPWGIGTIKTPWMGNYLNCIWV